MNLTAQERSVVEEIARREGELVELVSTLVSFDTTARSSVDAPARDEAGLQAYLADRLQTSGATVDVWEPDPANVAGTPLAPDGLGFEGRPQLVATFGGTGGGQSLLLNGHIDVVSAEPRERWNVDPFRAEVRDGRLYGRGTCDMKGGIGCMVLAAEVLASLGIGLPGDLIVCTVTDEESTGAGALAAVVHGIRADGGIVVEPSDFDVWIACRGSLIPTVTVAGRPGHAGAPPPHWQQGGPVNAIAKADIVLGAMRLLQEDWHGSLEQQHPLLSPGDIVPCVIAGGEWAVNYPSSCSVTYHISYPPTGADDDAWGSLIGREIEEWISRAAAADPWLAENPPTIAWAPSAPSSNVSQDEPIVRAVLGAARDVGRHGRIAGADVWHDGATFTRVGETPCVAFGPPSIDVAHTIDESVPIDGLVRCAQALALAALRFCAREAS